MLIPIWGPLAFFLWRVTSAFPTHPFLLSEAP
jgi:hypothetical protein